MMQRIPAFAILLTGLLANSATTSTAESWPAWRGPRGDGTCLEKDVPTNWDPSSAVWKVEIPGKGHASAIVWSDRVFTVTAQPDTQERMLVCVDRASGKILWQQTVVQGPLGKLHQENSYASGTPATDGELVFVTFQDGDEIVVAAHEFASGKQRWLVRAGTHMSAWGFSNEPVLFQDKVIVDGDSNGDSFLVALSRADGKVLWRVKRSHHGASWSAPLIREVVGRTQLIQCGDRCVSSFDPNTARQFWAVDGPWDEFVATPVYSERAGLVFVSSSWPKQVLVAIRPDGSGDITQAHVVWRDEKGASYVPSLMVTGDFLLSVNNGGMAFCHEAATGKVFWQEKLGRHHASPVLAGGLAYFINDNGEINVVRPGAQFERVAQYQLGEHCYASPAISDGQVFLRGFKHVFCIGQKTNH